MPAQRIPGLARNKPIRRKPREDPHSRKHKIVDVPTPFPLPKILQTLRAPPRLKPSVQSNSFRVSESCSSSPPEPSRPSRRPLRDIHKTLSPRKGCGRAKSLSFIGFVAHVSTCVSPSRFAPNKNGAAPKNELRHFHDSIFFRLQCRSWSRSSQSRSLCQRCPSSSHQR